MKPIYNTILIFLFLLLQSINYSCEKMIEVDMPGNQIGSSEVFEDAGTANAALAGLYANLFDDSVLSGNGLGALLGSYTDDLTGYYPNQTNGAMDIYRNQQLSSNTLVYNIWSKAYNHIYMANTIITGAEKSQKLSINDKNRIKGEALLVRVVIYFYLQQLFGDIPYATSTDYLLNQNLGKTAGNDVINNLEEDLKQVSTLLRTEYRSPERIYPNKQVTQLMLAKILLLKKQWNPAEMLLKEILQNSQYHFQQDINKVFDKSGTHILWQLKPANEGDATKEAGFYYFDNSVPNTYALSQDLVDIFSAEDLRKQHWMDPVLFNQNMYYRYAKYKNIVPGSNTSEYSIIFRLEEVYLLLAESLAEQSRVSEAIPYVNATRQRAGLSPLITSISKQECLIEILQENRREFFAEMGHRFFDLKRSNRLNTLLSIKPNWKSFHNLWPIPQKDLIINPNLNPQNPGY